MLNNYKKRRGRPRKTLDKIEIPKVIKDENIVVYFALSDETNEETDDDNCFTANDDINDKDVELNTVSETEPTTHYQSIIKKLTDEIKTKDKIIAALKSKPKIRSTKTYNYINYSDATFEPKNNNFKCWWCDDYFDNLPAYIINYLRNDIYYVFGNFCSFNCALKYNVKMLNDFKCRTRHALTNSFRVKVTNNDQQIKLAGERETINTKGGQYSIDEFRNGFSIITESMRMNMPKITSLDSLNE